MCVQCNLGNIGSGLNHLTPSFIKITHDFNQLNLFSYDYFEEGKKESEREFSMSIRRMSS